jgi:hypothetical protein
MPVQIAPNRSRSNVAVGFVVMGVAVAFISPRPAGAFVTHHHDVAKAAAATNATMR